MSDEPRARVDHVKVSEAEAQEFFAALYEALVRSDDANLRRLRISGRSNDGLPISFDGRWEPFLGHTIGYNNNSKPPRIPIAAPSRVLGRVELWLQHLDRPTAGGRVFLNNRGVTCDHQTIGTWEWPGDLMHRFIVVYSGCIARLQKRERQKV